MKRTIAFILCIILIFSSVPVFAADQQVSEADFTADRASALLSKRNYEVKNNVYLSAPIPQYSLSDTTHISNIYLIFDGNEHIGIVSVCSKNNEFYTSSSMLSFDALENLKSVGSSVAFFQHENCMILYYEDQWNILLNPTDNEIDFNGIAVEEDLCTPIILEQPLTLLASRSVDYMLEVPHVESTLINGVGICWAACMASKISYQQDLSTTLTATEVFNACQSTTTTETPCGSDPWYSVAASQYNMSITVMDRPIASEARLVRCFVQNKPILITMRRTLSNGTKTAHNVVICGVDLDADADFYEFIAMDPNVHDNDSNVYDDYITIGVPSSCLEDGTDFYYAPYYATYTEWTYTRY